MAEPDENPSTSSPDFSAPETSEGGIVAPANEDGLPTLDDVFAAALDGGPGAIDSEEEVPPESVEDAEPAPEPAPEPAADPEPAPEPAVDPDLASRFERLAARERELSEQRRAQQEYEQRLREQEQAVADRLRRLEEEEQFLAALESGDVLAALDAKGYSLEDLNQAALDGRGLAPNKPLETKLQALERRIQEKEAAEARQRELQAQQARELAAVREVSAELETRAPELAAMGDAGAQMIIGIAREQHAQTGQTPSYDTLVNEGQRRLYEFLDRVLAVDAVRQRYLADNPDSKQSPPQAAPGVSNAAAAEPAASKLPEDVDLFELDPAEQFDALFPSGIPS